MFRDSILAGLALIRAAIRSPNYDGNGTGTPPAAQGWSIGKDGFAELANVLLRGSLTFGNGASLSDEGLELPAFHAGTPDPPELSSIRWTTSGGTVTIAEISAGIVGPPSPFQYLAIAIDGRLMVNGRRLLETQHDLELAATNGDSSAQFGPVAVAFPEPFDAPPALQLTPAENRTLAKNQYVPAFDNLTTTGFDLYLWKLDAGAAAATTDTPVAWQATGPLP